MIQALINWLKNKILNEVEFETLEKKYKTRKVKRDVDVIMAKSNKIPENSSAFKVLSSTRDTKVMAQTKK